MSIHSLALIVVLLLAQPRFFRAKLHPLTKESEILVVFLHVSSIRFPSSVPISDVFRRSKFALTDNYHNYELRFS